MSQPPRITNAEAAKRAGYQAGQAIQQENLSHRDLSHRANLQYVRDGVPMTLFSWYKDGLVEGYRQKRQP